MGFVFSLNFDILNEHLSTHQVDKSPNYWERKENNQPKEKYSTEMLISNKLLLKLTPMILLYFPKFFRLQTRLDEEEVGEKVWMKMHMNFF